MKKLLAIAVVFALVAGAAFAETAVSGTVETRVFLIDAQGGAKNADGDDLIVAHGDIGAAYIQLSGTNDDGTLGGLFRFRNTDQAQWFHRVFVWWRPIEQVKIFLGIDNDGLFDTASIAGWGFHQGSNDYMFNHHWDFWRGIFPGNWDGFGLAVSLYPFEGFNFNIVFPFGNLGWRQYPKDSVEATKEWEYIMKSLRFQGSYNLDGIGQIQFAINLGDKDADNTGPHDSAFGDQDGAFLGRYGVSFLLTSIDSIQILVGGSVAAFDGDVDPLISPGAAITYTGEGFGVKARVGANIQDKYTFVTFNVMPYFDLGPGTLMIDIGASMDLSDNAPKDDMGWFATPVYRLPISGGQFSIGMQIYSNIQMGGNISLKAPTDVSFRIPMLLSFNF